MKLCVQKIITLHNVLIDVDLMSARMYIVDSKGRFLVESEPV